MGKREKKKPRGKAFGTGANNPRHNRNLHGQSDAKSDANSLHALEGKQIDAASIRAGESPAVSDKAATNYINSSTLRIPPDKKSLRSLAADIDPAELAEAYAELRAMGIDPETGEPIGAEG